MPRYCPVSSAAQADSCKVMDNVKMLAAGDSGALTPLSSSA